MSRGIDLAKTLASTPEGAEAIEDMKDQLIIVLIKKLGGWVDIPVAELDGTEGDNLLLGFLPETKTFHFEVRTE